MTAKQLSQARIANELGITPAYLSYMVNGKWPWRPSLKDQYQRLVNVVNDLGANVKRGQQRLAGGLGAGEEIRTPDFLLGKQTLCH